MKLPCGIAVLLVVLACPAVFCRGNRGCSLADILNLEDNMSLEMANSRGTVFGTRQGRMSVSCNGIPFSSFQIVAEQDENGAFTGRVSRDDFPSCSSVESQQDCAVPRATVKHFIKKFLSENNKTGKKMKRRYVKTNRALMVRGDDVILAEEVDFLFQNKLDVVRGMIVIDACRGELIAAKNTKAALGIQQESHQVAETESRQRRSSASSSPSSCVSGTGGNSLLGPVNFGGGADEVCLAVQQSGDTCTLETAAGRVVSATGDGGCQSGTPISFSCSEGPNDSTANGGNSPALDVMFGFQTIADVFKNWYNTPAPVANPEACVYFGNQLSNALAIGEQLLFGNGLTGFSSPFTTLGAVCHEYAHLITEKYSKLLHTEQSGGVNDAFADAFSRTCRKYAGIEDTWYEGAGLLFSYPQGFRSYANPTFDGLSIDNAADYTPGLDSHRSCGIFNKFFYCLTEEQGTTTVRDGFLTYMLANELFWVPDSDFEDAACGVLRASVMSGVNTDSVRTCFNNVGVSLASCSLDSVEQVLCQGDSKRKDVTVSSTTSPYFRVCASRGSGFTVKTKPRTTILVSTGSPYSAPEVSGKGKVKFDGSLDGAVYIRLQGDSTDATQVSIDVKF